RRAPPTGWRPAPPPAPRRAPAPGPPRAPTPRRPRSFGSSRSSRPPLVSSRPLPFTLLPSRYRVGSPPSVGQPSRSRRESYRVRERGGSAQTHHRDAKAAVRRPPAVGGGERGRARGRPPQGDEGGSPALQAEQHVPARLQRPRPQREARV